AGHRPWQRRSMSCRIREKGARPGLRRSRTMSLPTRDELNQFVDDEFREQHPAAPERLDPNDPSHAQYIAAWAAIRDKKVTDWTDDVFASFFPDAGRLDQNDPRDSAL